MTANAFLPLNRACLLRALEHTAKTIGSAEPILGRVREGLFERMQAMVIEAGIVLDLGSATGAGLGLLTKRFPRARIIGCDLSAAMLQAHRHEAGRFSRPALVRCDAQLLPVADASVDVIFANLLLPWLDEPGRLFREVRRVLRTDGLFAFSTLGPDSLRQLREAWLAVDSSAHVQHFADMHDIGDAALSAGLRDPVLDVEHLRLTYRHAADLFADLRNSGARNCLADRRRGLLGRGDLDRLTRSLDMMRIDGLIPVDLEIVYGHCWGSPPTGNMTEYAVDAGLIGRRR